MSLQLIHMSLFDILILPCLYLLPGKALKLNQMSLVRLDLL